MFYIQVVDRSYEYVTTPADPDDRWSCDDTCEEHSIEGIRVVSENDCWDLVVNFNPREINSYLLYGIYNSGCSFCMNEGKIEFVHLFQNYEYAKESEKRLEEHVRLYQQLNHGGWYGGNKASKKLRKQHPNFSPHSTKIIGDDGKAFKVSVPWNGYFEPFVYAAGETVTCKQ